jgi:formyltetrahydrofolate deformylase
LIRNYYKELNINIKAVISNYPVLEQLTRKFDIPFHFISHEEYTRDEHEKKILAAINSYQPSYLVLAKYMRILSPVFISHFRNRIINIHHSFLPAFAGANPYLRAYEKGVKIIGATAHFVNDQLDEGPIIAQNVFPVAHSHSASDMAQSGKDVEKMVLAKALKLVLEKRVFV